MLNAKEATKATGQRSPRWAFMRRFRLTTAEGDTYLDRLRIVQTPWFGVYLHRLGTPDPGVDLHDHPWPFVSVILRGGYEEQVAPTRSAPERARRAEAMPMANFMRGLPRSWRRGSMHRLRLTECHRISTLFRVPTWTLILAGRRQQPWGFYTPSGFVDSRDYDELGRRDLRQRERA
jgi:hypothetical protein